MLYKVWRFVHMLSHIPLGFGEPRWATSFHDWTAHKWKIAIHATSAPHSSTPEVKA